MKWEWDFPNSQFPKFPVPFPMGWDGNGIESLGMGWEWDSKLKIDREWDGIGNRVVGNGMGMGSIFKLCRPLVEINKHQDRFEL